MAGKPGQLDKSLVMEISLAKRKIFLDTLARTGVVKTSALKAGYADSTLMQRLRRTDPEFAAQWEEALQTALHDVFEPELVRRAVHGVDENVHFKGEVIDTVVRASDALLMFLLKAANPKKYRESINVTGEVNHNVGIALLPITAPLLEDWEKSALEVHANQQLLAPPKELPIIDVPGSIGLSLKRG